MSDEWTDSAPTESGHYWVTDGGTVAYVRAVREAGRLKYRTLGGCIYPGSRRYRWMPASLPPTPDDAATGRVVT